MTATASIFNILQVELGDEAERQSLHFFRRQTLQKSAIYFESEFWSRLVLQLCHSQPVIRHAVAALGALHQRHEVAISVELSGEIEAGLRCYALQQYSKALAGTHDLVDQNKENALDLTLVLCVLFVCLANHLSDYDGGEIHLQNGFKMLAIWQRNDKRKTSSRLSIFRETTQLLEDDIIHQFARLELQSTTFHNDRFKESMVYYDTTTAPTVKSFHSLSTARNALYMNLVRIQRTGNAFQGHFSPLTGAPSRVPPDELIEILYECTQHLEDWRVSFSKYMERASSTMDVKTLSAALLLKAYHMLGTIAMPMEGAEGTGNEDTFLPQMEDILSWTESAAKATDDHCSTKMTGFSFELGVIMPLYFIGSNCRQPATRRRAIELLKATPRREGLWDNLSAAFVAQRIADVEEEGLETVRTASDVPISSRVYHNSVDMRPDQKRVDAKFGLKPFGADGPFVYRTEVITW
jgi:hypothetical protein